MLGFVCLFLVWSIHFLVRAETLPFNGAIHSLYINNDAISNFSTFPTSFAIKPNVYVFTHQYFIITANHSAPSPYPCAQIYFANRRNCGLIHKKFQFGR